VKEKHIGLDGMKYVKTRRMEERGSKSSKNSILIMMLSKHGWRILHNKELLFSQCLKGRYFLRGDFLITFVGHNPNYTWRSIMHAKVEVIGKAGVWKVCDGKSIQVWKYN